MEAFYSRHRHGRLSSMFFLFLLNLSTSGHRAIATFRHLISYGFELYSLITGRGYYEIMEAIEAPIIRAWWGLALYGAVEFFSLLNCNRLMFGLDLLFGSTRHCMADWYDSYSYIF
jgi:hypothetical protein